MDSETAIASEWEDDQEVSLQRDGMVIGGLVYPVEVFVHGSSAS